MHLPPAAALRHFEQQRRPRPRLLPEGGRRGRGGGRVGGGRYRISPANGTVPKGFGSPVNIPHSIPLPHLQAHAEPTRKAYRLPNNSTQLANTLTGTRHVHREDFATCSPGVHTACACARKAARRPRDPTPTICRWCQRLQSAIRFKFMINRYFAQPMKSFPIPPMKSFTLYKQSR